jgi:glycosyltransferase involved in cell wall biosynthesis
MQHIEPELEIAIVEAMATGLPLVLTGTDGPRGLVLEQYAIWGEPDNVIGLAQLLKRDSVLGRTLREYILRRFATAPRTFNR